MNSRQVSKAAAMNSPISLIPVGVIHAFELLKDDWSFWRVSQGLLGRHWPRQLHDRPPTFVKDAGRTPPASVLKEYEDETAALLAFEQSSCLALPPRSARKRQMRPPHKPAPHPHNLVNSSLWEP